MNIRRIGLMIPLVTILFCVMSRAQYPSDEKTPFAEYLKNESDSEMQKGGSYYADRKVDSVKAPNPTVSLLKSAVIPGWGQISNGKYIKAGVVIALEATLIGTYIHYRNKTEDARDVFEGAALDDKSNLYREFDNAKDQRNRFAWYCATMIFISMFDAYVDAHLANFPKREKNLSFDFKPSVDEPIRVSVAYNFR
jgi:hypothetical protein